MSGEIIGQEKDLVLLLGSFLVYKQVDCLYELIQYINSYDSSDIFEIIQVVKDHLSNTLIEWFVTLLQLFQEEVILRELLSLPITNEFALAVVNIVSPEDLNTFISFWGDYDA